MQAVLISFCSCHPTVYSGRGPAGTILHRRISMTPGARHEKVSKKKKKKTHPKMVKFPFSLETQQPNAAAYPFPNTHHFSSSAFLRTNK